MFVYPPSENEMGKSERVKVLLYESVYECIYTVCINLIG